MSDDARPHPEWKEHLAFVSGTILLGSIAMAKVIPFAATIPLAASPSALVASNGEADPHLLPFLLISLSGAFGLTGVALALFHVVARGLWLAQRAASPHAHDEHLERWARRTFAAVAIVASLAVVFAIPLTLVLVISVPLQRWLVHHLGVHSRVIGAILMLLVYMLLGGISGALLPKRLSFKRVTHFWRDFERALGLAVLAVGLFGLLFLCLEWLPRTAELEVRTGGATQRPTADVFLRLGGLTSDVSYARVRLEDAAGHIIRELRPDPFGEGIYAARIDLSGMAPGVYDAVLEYPALDMALFPPQIHRHIRRDCRFLVPPL